MIDRWQWRAACKNMQDLFDMAAGTMGRSSQQWPEEQNTVWRREAHSVCMRCPVFNECLEDAMTDDPFYGEKRGYLAATTLRQRRRIRAKTKNPTRRTA